MMTKTNTKKTHTKEQLKTRQREIIDNLIRFRYLTTLQIQLLLTHKAKENIRVWLNDLTEKQYVFRFYKKEFVQKPSLFCLEKKSIPYLREKDIDEHIIKWLYKGKTRPQMFRDHHIFIADIYLSLLNLVKQTKATLTFYTKTELYDIQYLVWPHPDCYFRIKEQSGKSKYYFLDVFDDGTFMYKRVYQYFSYYKKQYWQTKTKKKFPEIIFVCCDESAKKAISRFIQKKIFYNSPVFYVSTKLEIQKKGMCKEILMKISAE